MKEDVKKILVVFHSQRRATSDERKRRFKVDTTPFWCCSMILPSIDYHNSILILAFYCHNMIEEGLLLLGTHFSLKFSQTITHI